MAAKIMVFNASCKINLSELKDQFLSSKQTLVLLHYKYNTLTFIHLTFVTLLFLPFSIIIILNFYHMFFPFIQFHSTQQRIRSWISHNNQGFNLGKDNVGEIHHSNFDWVCLNRGKDCNFLAAEGREQECKRQSQVSRQFYQVIPMAEISCLA